jgi:hypothetical protein
MQLPFAEMQPMTIASGQTRPWGIAVSSEDVFWLSAEGVFKAPIGGNLATPVSTASLPESSSLAVDGVSAYWVGNGGGIVKTPLVGGDVEVLVSAPVSASAGIAVDATSVYWDSAGTIMKVTPK